MTATQVVENEAARETAPVTSNAAKALKSMQEDAKMVKVNLDDVFISKSENIRNMNTGYTEESIGEMAAQIEAVGGLLQPLGIVRVTASPDTENKELQLVWGFRRAYALLYLAETDSKWKEAVPARLITKGVGPIGAVRIVQLMENVARKNVNSMEIALAINEAMNDKESDFNQQDIARMLGLSTSIVSQYLKLLRFPKSIQELISNGNLTFSHAREILSRVGETAWANVAKKATGMTFGAFKDYLDKEYPKDGESEEGEEGAEATGDKSASQKPAKMLRATDVTSKYIPFLKKQAESADKQTKAYTAADIAQAKLDAVNTVLLNPETQLSKDIAPFLEELKKKEEDEKKNEAAKNEETKFFKEQVKRIEALFDAPIDPANPNAARPTLTQVYAQVAKEITALDAEKKAALGFALPASAEELVKKLAETYTQTVKDRAEAKKKRDDAKAKKAAEEKEAAEKAKAGAAS